MTAVRRIRHQALEAVPEDAGAAGLPESSLNDRQRAALLLQGAALLAHLRTAGWRLESWRGLAVDARGVLRIEPGMVTVGRDGRSPQAVLRRFASLLFGSEEMVGRSAVRAALRPVVVGWRDLLLPFPADRLVADILDHAPFLWGGEYRAARVSLVAVHEREEGEEVVIVGHSRWRRSLLRAAGPDPEGLSTVTERLSTITERLSTILGSDEALEHWLGDNASGGPIDWIARGDWRRAVDESLREPLAEPGERSAVARALLDSGRFEAALALVKGSRRTEDILIRLKGLVRMGRMAAARRTLTVLEKRRLGGAAKLEECEEAIRIHGAAGRPAQLKAWAERAVEAAVGPFAGRGRALAVLAMREVGATGEMASLLEPASMLNPEGEPEDWMSCLARARLALDGGHFTEADQALATALKQFRRHLPVYDRASLWNELATLRRSVFLLAGLGEEARVVGAGAACAGLWEAVSENRAPSSADWRRLEEQGAYRCALTIHDLVCLGVETVPVGLLESAVGTLSEVGAEAPAQRVDGARLGPWRALRAFLDAGEFDSSTFHSLLSSAGHPEARIVVHESLAVAGQDEAKEVLLEGPGGSEQFSVGVPAGKLVLSADRIEEPGRALLTVIAGRAPAASRRRRHDLELAEARKSTTSGMMGRSKALVAAQERVEKLASHDLPVLILGESGTGKELLARQLHDSSARASGPWLAVNCAALPEGLLLSDLFGHLRGSFTGADRDRIGVFESAEGGTVFLDEIAELPRAAQGMLLRILQEGEMRRVGESHSRRLDFRLVSATHRDLSAMVEAGEFREDLYYRLRVANVEAPALRDRDDDVMLLAHHFLGMFSGDRVSLRFSERACRRILEYPWPGNVRELRNAIESAAALAEGPEIAVEMLGLPNEPRRPAQAEGASYHRKLEQYRRGLIRKALAEAGGNQARAARSLGLSRQALSYLVRKLNYAP